jgi:cell division septation protein DedD
MASAILKTVIEERLKLRLTGAAIVVALMVLLVPEMFRGRPPAAPVADGNVAGGPPLRSYTIDLKDGGVRGAAPEGAGVRDTPALAAPPAAVPATPTGVPVAPVDRTAAGAPLGAPGGTSVAGAPATAPAAMPATAPAVAPVAAPATAPAAAPSAVPPPAPASAAAAPPAGQAAEAAAGSFQVQLGLFASQANARRLATQAARQGVRALVSGPDARGLYRVHTATYRSRAEAQAVQQKLRELGLSAAVTAPR